MIHALSSTPSGVLTVMNSGRLSPSPETFSLSFALLAMVRTSVPPVQTLRRSDGTLVRTIASNAKLREKGSGLGLNRPEFITVKTPDGVELNAWIIKPKGFDPTRRYPLLMNVYGGPGSPTVTHFRGGADCLWPHQLAPERELGRSR